MRPSQLVCDGKVMQGQADDEEITWEALESKIGRNARSPREECDLIARQLDNDPHMTAIWR